MEQRIDRASQALGMSFSKARHRLERQILLKLLTDAGNNVCYQCSGTIETVQDLSIEHKQPWRKKHVELFWDLDNIAFSHFSCNSRAGSLNVVPANFKPVTDGQAWCSGCQVERPIDEFHRQGSSYRNVQSYCRGCHNTREKIRKQRARAEQRRLEGKPPTKKDLLV